MGNNMERPKVSISRVGDSLFEAVDQAIELAGGLKDLVTPSSQVLVKPNIYASEPSGTGKITDARVVEAIVRHLQRLGPRRIIIGEGSAAGYLFMKGHNTEEAFTVSGYRDLAAKLGVDLVNLNTDPAQDVPVPDYLVLSSAKIATTALESDVIIDVPVLKTHVSCGLSVALKNMKGVLSGNEKRKTHALGVEKAVTDLNSVIRPKFVVVDATMAMEGLWEVPDDCVPLNLILAGTNPLTVDTVCAHLMGFDPHKIFTLKLCAEKGLGEIDLDRIEIVGEPLESVKRPFRTSFGTLQDRYPGVQVVEKDACTGCHREFNFALHAVRNAGFDPELLKLVVALGSPEELPEGPNPLIVGTCARHLRDRGLFVNGCPPGPEDVITGIAKVCGIDPEVVLEKRRQALASM
jgi:uncharacterized protein (DUF362 family)